MGILEKIADIENEVGILIVLCVQSKRFFDSIGCFWQMARTQKNKNTSHHLGLLKAKLAKLRRELITPKSSGGPAGEGE